VEQHAEKIKKSDAALTLSLEPTTDILSEVAKNKGQKIVVGFAAETDHVAENARKKTFREECRPDRRQTMSPPKVQASTAIQISSRSSHAMAATSRFRK